ncbi:MAG: DUF3256 family protein [Bacteroidales bacterium]|nr:DUF3256 family protein [Candidatus Colicola faecequi]
MKKLTFVLLIMLASAGVRAQVAIAWINLPDSICPFLQEQQRFTLLQYAKAGLKDSIENQFDGHSYIDSINLTDGFIRAQIAPNMTLELATEAQIVAQEGDEAIAEDNNRVSITVCAPICSTITTWYDKNWKFLRREKQPWSIEQTEEEKLQHF